MKELTLKEVGEHPGFCSKYYAGGRDLTRNKRVQSPCMAWEPVVIRFSGHTLLHYFSYTSFNPMSGYCLPIPALPLFVISPQRTPQLFLQKQVEKLM